MAVIKQIKTDASHTYDLAVYNTNVTRTNSMNTSGSVNTLDRAFINKARANRTAFMPAAAIKIEYSSDGGSTWTTSSATDAQKRNLFAETQGYSCPVGPGSGTVTTNYRTRITVEPTDRYAYVDTAYIWLSTPHGLQCDIERSTIGNKDTFSYIRQNVPVSGWSGPNEIAFAPGTFGGSAGQTSNTYKYRFTFKVISVLSSYSTSQPGILDIRMYGTSSWTAGNSYAGGDHLYSWDYDQNVTFPKKVTATSFAGDGSALTNVPDTKVQQNAAITTAGNYPVLLANSTATSQVTGAVNKTSSLLYNPSTGLLSATKFAGDGSSITNISTGAYVDNDDVLHMF